MRISCWNVLCVCVCARVHVSVCLGVYVHVMGVRKSKGHSWKRKGLYFGNKQETVMLVLPKSTLLSLPHLRRAKREKPGCWLWVRIPISPEHQNLSQFLPFFTYSFSTNYPFSLDILIDVYKLKYLLRTLRH